jgi:phosphonate transport system ATP-binding protein
VSGDAVFMLQGVGVRFGVRPALSSVDLRIDGGERVAVIGPSGAGKSTLLNVLNGMVVPTDGRVCVLGKDPAILHERELRRLRSQIGTVHQRLNLVGPLRAVHNAAAGRLGRTSTARALASLVTGRGLDDAINALVRVGLGDRRDERTDRLSGGEQQRVAIARLLVQRPVATLADEPVSSLDPARARMVMDLLMGVTAEIDTTLVVSLHDVDLALERFDRVVAVRDGTIAFDVPPDRVRPEMIGALYAQGEAS